jgi:hypothetical protein
MNFKFKKTKLFEVMSGGDGLQTQRETANVVNKQSQT